MKIIKWYQRFVRSFTFLVALMVFIFGVIPGAFSAYPSYVADSNSVEPVIRTGDIVYTDIAAKNIEVGEIIAYRLLNGQITSNMVEEKTDKGYIVLENNNELKSSYVVTKEQIVGIYKFRIPKLGLYINQIDETKIVFYMFFGMAVLGVLNFIVIMLEHPFGC